MKNKIIAFIIAFAAAFAVTASPAAELSGGYFSASAAEISILDDYESKYYYNLLTDRQQEAYGLLYDSVQGNKTNIDISGYHFDDSALSMIVTLIKYENPQIFNIDGAATGTGDPVTHDWLTINPNYIRSAAQTRSIRTQMETAAAPIIEEALKSDDVFERVKVLHDAVVNMTAYTLNGPVYKSEADGPLVHGRALCEGYAKAFAYLCQSIGVPCICVVGSGNGENHMWNMVQIGGDWYHVDATWDDPVSTTPVLRHDYFCVSTDTIRKDHSISNPVAIPEAVKDYDGSMSESAPQAPDASGETSEPGLSGTVVIDASFSVIPDSEISGSGFMFSYTNRIPRSAYSPAGGELKARFDMAGTGSHALLVYYAGTRESGKTATLFAYNDSDGKVSYVSHAAVDGSGNADLDVYGAGRYFIVLDRNAKIPGDMNGDGNINALDAALILRSIANGETPDSFFGDFNGDGNANAIDAAAILARGVA